MRTLLAIPFLLLFLLNALLLQAAPPLPKGLEQVSEAIQDGQDHQLSSKTEELKKQLDEAVPNFFKAVQAVHDHEPFNKEEALWVFRNAMLSHLPRIEGLKEIGLSERPEVNEELKFRREKGLEYLKSLGTDSHDGWDQLLMTRSSLEFLEQLTQSLSKD